jgi:hypothetical protein
MLDIGFDSTTENTAYFRCSTLLSGCRTRSHRSKFLFCTDPCQAYADTRDVWERGFFSVCYVPSLMKATLENGPGDLASAPLRPTRMGHIIAFQQRCDA